MRGPETVQVKVKLPFLELSGSWSPNEIERKAAWELYVELVTRIGVVPLSRDDGLVREALTSLHSLFDVVRDVLRRYGPIVAEPKKSGQYNFGWLAVAMLNFAVRPVLARWHPLLSDWEAIREDGRAPGEHERAWERWDLVRADLNALREALVAYSRLYAHACGIPDLLGAVPVPVDGVDV